MAEQTEKAFLKQPKVFLSTKKSGKGKKPARAATASGRALALASRPPGKQLKDAS